MSNFQIRPSIDVDVTKAPLVAIAGPSGCGKTESALRLARGFCGPNEKFVVIDTEEKRALYKKKRYQPWDWMDFQPPFTPEAYVEALEAAKGYKAVILDSGSHEYSGPGGLQDIAQETLERMSKGDERRMEALTGPSWKDAKLRHKSKFMSYLIRYPTLLIICLRAEPKVKFVKVDGKMQIVDAGYQPICEKQFMYEMLVGCKMTPDKAGIPEHIKQLEKELEPVFIAGEQINEQTGERLAAWCAGRESQAMTKMLAAFATIGISAATELGRVPTESDLDALRVIYQQRKNPKKVAHSEPPPKPQVDERRETNEQDVF
jgi:energy-coupling factor transporter ATP-binding protein EcfA2